MTRVEAALAECDRCIEACAAGKAGSWTVAREEPDDAWSTVQRETPTVGYLAMLRIGRDVLTRHGEFHQCRDGRHYVCADTTYRGCIAQPGYCPEARPWLELLAPEPTP